MKMYQEKLNLLVKEGPAADIFRAEQALSILKATGEAAEEINKNNYGEVFSTFQAFCIDQFILSTSKLYETPRGYPLKSIPAVLEFLKENAHHLDITEPYLLNKQLSRLNIFCPEFDKLDLVEKTLFIHRKLLGLLPSIRNNEALAAIKTLRDKKVAHPEDISIETLQKTTWAMAEELLQYPKDVLGVIGDGYLSTVYMLDNGEYMLSNDAKRVGRGVKRLLTNMGIIEKKKGQTFS